jgi:DNA-binding response OmpR family regulator
MKVLIIEDDQSIIDAIKMAFEFRWPDSSIVYAKSGKRGIVMVSQESPDIVILDINLPDLSGFEVLKQVREFSSVPIIILTVRAEDEDIMKGLESGADDYIVKPFNYLTLLARVKAVLRRSRTMPFKGTLNNIVNARLSIDFVNQKVKVDNRLVRLAPLEYKILVSLVKNSNKVVPYNTIMSEIWGRSYSLDNRNLRLGIRRLRQKLQDTPPRMIINKRGSGYILVS